MLMLAIGFGFMLLGPASSSTQGSDNHESYPDRVAGYEVLDVRDSKNTSCYPKDVPLFVLKTTETSVENLMSSDTFNFDTIKRALVDAGYSENTEVIMAGPSFTKEQAQQKRADWNRVRNERGCIRLETWPGTPILPKPLFS